MVATESQNGGVCVSRGIKAGPTLEFKWQKSRGGKKGTRVRGARRSDIEVQQQARPTQEKSTPQPASESACQKIDRLSKAPRRQTGTDTSAYAAELPFRVRRCRSPP